MHERITTIGLLGAGKIGSNVARAVLANCQEVVLANSRGPETLAEPIAELGPNARAATTREAAHLSESKVAKAFNHIHAPQIVTTAVPAGTPDRRALATASDMADASDFVVDLNDEIGFDAVVIGPLADSWRVERDRPADVVASPLGGRVSRRPRIPSVVE